MQAPDFLREPAPLVYRPQRWDGPGFDPETPPGRWPPVAWLFLAGAVATLVAILIGGVR